MNHRCDFFLSLLSSHVSVGPVGFQFMGWTSAAGSGGSAAVTATGRSAAVTATGGASVENQEDMADLALVNAPPTD